MHQPAAQKILLNPVERRPKIMASVDRSAASQHPLRSYSGPREIGVPKLKRRGRECHLLTPIHMTRLYPLHTRRKRIEPLTHLERRCHDVVAMSGRARLRSG